MEYQTVINKKKREEKVRSNNSFTIYYNIICEKGKSGKGQKK